MGDAAAGDGVLQRLRDVRLSDDLRKGLRPEAAGQDRVVGAGRIHESRALPRKHEARRTMRSAKHEREHQGAMACFGLRALGHSLDIRISCFAEWWLLDGAQKRGGQKLSPHAPESQRLGLLRLRPDPVERGPTAFGDSFSSPVRKSSRQGRSALSGGNARQASGSREDLYECETPTTASPVPLLSHGRSLHNLRADKSHPRAAALGANARQRSISFLTLRDLCSRTPATEAAAHKVLFQPEGRGTLRERAQRWRNRSLQSTHRSRTRPTHSLLRPTAVSNGASGGMTGAFVAYEVGDFYDELFEPPGHPRRECEVLFSHLQRLSPDDLQRRQLAADRSMLGLGITFNVYGDGQGTERIIPFDIVPRILGGAEWNEIERGLNQRIAALNLFIDDIYHDQRIVRDGVIPEHIIQTACLLSPAVHRAQSAQGHLVPHHRHRPGPRPRRPVLRARRQPPLSVGRVVRPGKPRS